MNRKIILLFSFVLFFSAGFSFLYPDENENEIIRRCWSSDQQP